MPHSRQTSYDAVIVGAGPNGLAAAVELARAGHSVLVREAAPTVGGTTRSAALTLPGYVHDVCAAIHPLAVVSPAFRRWPLAEHGLRWAQPEVLLAHPLVGRPPALLLHSLDDTAASLNEDGTRDGDAYRDLARPFVRRFDALLEDALAPLHLPRHPILLARFGLQALRSARGLAERRFEGERTRALFAGIAAHAIVPLTFAASASFGLVLAFAAHVGGWPVAAGGSQAIADALASYLRALGGIVECDAPVHSLDELPPSRAVLLDVTPAQLLRIAGDRLPSGYRDRLRRFRYGPGVFKVDYALSAPVPWRDAACGRAGTVHLGGTLEELDACETAVWNGELPPRPFVLVAQQSVVDPARAPAGHHTLWTYTHVPNGSQADMTAAIEAEIERHAPGFRDVIVAREARGPATLERYNPNLIGGSISGGANILGQLFLRPVAKLDPYATPLPGVWLCSASTPPGGGVHGLCGMYAARSVLRAWGA